MVFLGKGNVILNYETNEMNMQTIKLQNEVLANS